MLRQELIWTFTVCALIFALFIVADLFVKAWCLWKIFVVQTQGQCGSTIFSLNPGMEVNKAIAPVCVRVVGVRSLRQLCIFTSLNSPEI